MAHFQTGERTQMDGRTLPNLLSPCIAVHKNELCRILWSGSDQGCVNQIPDIFGLDSDSDPDPKKLYSDSGSVRDFTVKYDVNSDAESATSPDLNTNSSSGIRIDSNFGIRIDSNSGIRIAPSLVQTIFITTLSNVFLKTICIFKRSPLNFKWRMYCLRTLNIEKKIPTVALYPL